jgi:hypothetical protein
VIFFLPFSTMLSAFFLDISGTLVMISLAMNDYFASLSWASFYLTTPSLPELLIFYGLLYGLFKVISHYIGHNTSINKLNMNDADKYSFLVRLRSCPTWIYYLVSIAIIFFLIDAVYLRFYGNCYRCRSGEFHFYPLSRGAEHAH